jgi:hypothetical protein
MTTKYSDIRDQLDCGDIVLFSGNSFVSRLIRRFTNSEWSHVGITMRIYDYDMLMLFESTTLSNVKSMDGTYKKGVQVVPLSERIEAYDGKVAVRKYLGLVDDEFVGKMINFRNEVKDLPYEKDKLELIKSAYDGLFGQNHEDLSSVFCSELVAECLQYLSVLDKNEVSNEYTPNDFSIMLKDKYGPIVEVKYG